MIIAVTKNQLQFFKKLDLVPINCKFENMHAFLITGLEKKTEDEIAKIAGSLNAKILEFPLNKIDDVRNLNNLIRLAFTEPTLVVGKNIDLATEEALNALLKNLEEPQKNIYFLFTARNIKRVLPTVISRCQIINCGKGDVEKEFLVAEKFIKMTIYQKITFINKIKEREEAIRFVNELIFLLHKTLFSDGTVNKKRIKYSVAASNIELALKTLSGLNANGNVNLQLSNLAINFKEEYA